MHRLGAIGAVAGAALTCCAAPALAAAPGNNDLAAPQVITTAGSPFAGTNIDATTEAAEPHTNIGRTVWYSFTPGATGTYVFDTCASAGFDSLLTLYTGTTYPTLSKVAQNDGGCPGGGDIPARLIVNLTGGTPVRLQVAGYSQTSDDAGADASTFVLRVATASAPGNDAFEAPVVLNGAEPSAAFDTTLATKQAGEPVHNALPGATQTVWYSWTPPATAAVVASCDSAATQVAVYTGTALGSLTPVVAGGCRPPWIAQGGTNYRIAVATGDDEAGTLSIKAGGLSAPATAFGSVEVGKVGAQRTVTFTNSSPYAASVGIPETQSDEIMTSLAGTCFGSASVPAGESCTVKARFAPGSVGAKTGSLDLPYSFDANLHTASSTFSGTGTAPTAGPAGAPGPTGPTGTNGTNGSNGAQGPVGPAGGTGAQGPTGDTGPQGSAGTNGAQGPAGSNGLQGVAGPAGSAGVAGPAGAAGTQGPAGQDAAVTCKTKKSGKAKSSVKVSCVVSPGTRSARIVRRGLTVRRVQAHGGHLQVSGLQRGHYVVLVGTHGHVSRTRLTIR